MIRHHDPSVKFLREGDVAAIHTQTTISSLLLSPLHQDLYTAGFYAYPGGTAEPGALFFPAAHGGFSQYCIFCSASTHLSDNRHPHEGQKVLVYGSGQLRRSAPIGDCMTASLSLFIAIGACPGELWLNWPLPHITTGAKSSLPPAFLAKDKIFVAASAYTFFFSRSFCHDRTRYVSEVSNRVIASKYRNRCCSCFSPIRSQGTSKSAASLRGNSL